MSRFFAISKETVMRAGHFYRRKHYLSCFQTKWHQCIFIIIWPSQQRGYVQYWSAWRILAHPICPYCVQHACPISVPFITLHNLLLTIFRLIHCKKGTHISIRRISLQRPCRAWDITKMNAFSPLLAVLAHSEILPLCLENYNLY